MSRVFNVKLVLTDEKTGEQIATKTARIHETDIDAGLFHCEMKRRELFRDLAVHCGRHYKDFDSFLIEAVDA